MENQVENDDTQVNVTIKKPLRVLHFSDGVDEEIEEEIVNDVQSAPSNPRPDPSTMSWGPWLSHYAYKSGTKVLKAVDYAGESLASLFGITTPKYQIEIDEYERMQEEKRRIEEESLGWVPNNGGGNIPLVTNEPVKVINDSENV